MAEANWYVVHTYSGYENKVKANLEKPLKTASFRMRYWKLKYPLKMWLNLRMV